MTVYKSQNQQVLSHLKNKGPLSQNGAQRLYGVGRLAARIHDLREKGWGIVTETVRGGGKKWGRYWLISTTPRSTEGGEA